MNHACGPKSICKKTARRIPKTSKTDYFQEPKNLISPRPFLVAVMIAGSAAFATPFGYQTNVLVYQMGGYRYLDFVKVGLPLNILTWIVAVIAIHWFFPF